VDESKVRDEARRRSTPVRASRAPSHTCGL
jgi:hypothetical protein